MTMTTAVTVALTLFDLVRPMSVRTQERSRDRLRLTVSFALALVVVVLGTVLYLELVGLLLESSR
ncbi:hypothetical protein [Natronobacterium gregoryi]|uniref:Uncharacterized protein n=2 Tax=Natronobacterium gregoryi TaxID=44930 RepID=L0AEV2_NATGS|nr:hypothetical protein [Natronobacterium gregoryi]AFZ72443.1 hypothetical protein Natgr_1219 [Natronobacterium gregoryi SP2]ELY74315.1 hypothetical protein C490_00060 [Natronobacterium gregoryi SP2]PLK21417.1 hypothetical protein CYV19_03720 [Natronobacterium gregoryi SP2]SFI78427.1 hypothetical protein SAMN05443661_105123 [Natronobacterium gregoryi]